MQKYNTDYHTEREEPMMRRRLMAVVLAGVLAAPLAAYAKELAGATMPDTLSVGGKTLKLNGLGLAKKTLVKVYVAGLYLEAPSKDAAAILASNQTKAVRMHFLRNGSKKQLTDHFKEGFEANAKEKAAAQQSDVDKFLAMISDMKAGEELIFTYVAGTGTTFSKGDKVIGVLDGKDFGDVLYAVWLGPVPPSEDLKNGMLGM